MAAQTCSAPSAPSLTLFHQPSLSSSLIAEHTECEGAHWGAPRRAKGIAGDHASCFFLALAAFDKFRPSGAGKAP